MPKDFADVDWYSTESTRLGLPPRCLFASLDRCPKYFRSQSLLESAGIISSLEEEDKLRLEHRWRDQPATFLEDEPWLLSGDSGMSAVFNLCPEIGYDGLGRFSSTFSRYPDEIDSDLAHQRLREVGAPREDPRWTWSYISPLHYSECRHYSLLALGPMGYPDDETKRRIGFHEG